MSRHKQKRPSVSTTVQGHNNQHSTPNQHFKAGLGRRLWKNLIAGLAGVLIFTFVVNFNESYHWLWYRFTHINIANMKADLKSTYHERMVRHLGADYSFVLTIKSMTPENAIIFYPSKTDFLTPPTVGSRFPFRGNMVDKLAAVRVLYPRKVVTANEMGKTPYSDSLTHIAIVNGRNRDLVSYPTDTMATIDVLPTDERYYVPF